MEDIFNELEESFLSEIEQEFEAKTLAEKRREWGALGGRPSAIGEKRDIRKSVRYSPTEWEDVEYKAREFGVNPSDYIRRCSLGKRMPDPERNLTLTKSAINFKRLSNALRMGIFNEVERERFLGELEEVIILIKNELKNGNESQIS
ncbi:plasmid mobilization protein [Bergeyella zoohelcum]|uniref:Uncharacterized protein n=2 Tax=Bergeyella zoohelcum TaxID=1015 RepID=K1LPT7_9FLAO|nr:hypothetical protein [Bergeyella zoohelcum]EKB54122.1 hypothetical protein HMPREF9699_02105 [Bergeyella zoohelcum ATCC 43767]SUV65534.1 Uncharacterised protein [Bergeyella zoohelcum]VDH06595.1 Uncharacterised protein [Bergeyella zoohelcum]